MAQVVLLIFCTMFFILLKGEMVKFECMLLQRIDRDIISLVFARKVAIIVIKFTGGAFR